MSSKRFRATLFAAGLALASSTSVSAHDAAADVESAKRAIRLADLELAKAVADRNLEQFVARVDDNAVFFGSEVARGKEAVAKAWLPLFTDPSLFLKWYPNEVHVSSSADLGYSIGTYERRGKDKTGKATFATGSYVSIWRKQPDGKWKAVLDIGTPPSPPKR